MWDLDGDNVQDQVFVLRRIGDLAETGIEIRRRAERVPRYGAMVLKNYNQVEAPLFNFGLARSHKLGQILEPMQPTAWTALEQLRELLDDAENQLELEVGATTSVLEDVLRLI